MPQVELRVKKGTKSSQDIQVSVQDQTFEYLMTSNAPEIRVSAYLERDIDCVQSAYEELFVHEDCQFISSIQKLTPGSRTRKGISLPGAMFKGEQLTLMVSRTES